MTLHCFCEHSNKLSQNKIHPPTEPTSEMWEHEELNGKCNCSHRFPSSLDNVGYELCFNLHTPNLHIHQKRKAVIVLFYGILCISQYFSYGRMSRLFAWVDGINETQTRRMLHELTIHVMDEQKPRISIRMVLSWGKFCLPGTW